MDTFYFSHDYTARSDDKIKQLIRRHGMTGYGIYWAIVEDLYQNANALRIDCDGIAYDLRADCDMVKSIIFDFNLFVHDNEMFGSISIQKRIDKRKEKSAKARESAQYRWGNANALQSQSEGNAIKEIKVKENKVKENKVKENKVKENKENITANASHSAEIVNPFGSSGTRIWDAWKEYKRDEHRKSYKSAKTEQQAINQLYDLSGGNPETALKIVQQSIANQWQGLFELKTIKNGNQQPGKSLRESVKEEFKRRYPDSKHTID
jgi:hypothetical protein